MIINLQINIIIDLQVKLCYAFINLHMWQSFKMQVRKRGDEMSVLDDVFEEEKERLLRMQKAMEKELEALPKGYLSKKKIAGKEYYYLQHREGSKMKGSFVPAADVDNIRAQVDRRRQLQASLRECRDSIRKLERVI